MWLKEKLKVNNLKKEFMRIISEKISAEKKTEIATE